MTRNRVGWLSRMYVWSVTLEPMLFFVVFDRGVFGITGNVARLLQGLVVAGLVGRWLVGVLATGAVRRNRRAAPAWLLNHYVWYFGLAVLAGIIGYGSGAYDLSAAYLTAHETAAARLLNSASVRPVFEYVIAAYYFWYFAVLPRTVLRTPAGVNYMFRVFRGMFILSFAVGVVDLTSSLLLHIELVPRHIADGTMVGQRFHGLAGEPRHAFVYLFLGLAMLHLRAWFRGERLARAWTVAIILAAILTQSASGFLGIAAFLALFGAYTLRRISVRRAFQLTALVVVIAALSYVAVRTSLRLIAYRAAAADVWTALEQRRPLPGPLASQAESIYPIYDLVNKLRSGQLVPVLIGSGFGSAAVVNNRLAPNTDSLSNPNSQMVRSLYESGVVGTIFFILAFVVPVDRLTRSLGRRERYRFMTLTLLMLGCAFGFRSAAPFIFLGALVVTIPAAENRDRLADEAEAAV